LDAGIIGARARQWRHDDAVGKRVGAKLNGIEEVGGRDFGSGGCWRGHAVLLIEGGFGRASADLGGARLLRKGCAAVWRWGQAKRPLWEKQMAA
jgi:hypothetical protein